MFFIQKATEIRFDAWIFAQDNIKVKVNSKRSVEPNA